MASPEMRLQSTATALANFLACAHVATLDRAARAGTIRRPHFDDPTAEILAVRGDEHEQACLSHLREQGGAVASLSGPFEAALEGTRRALREGVPVLYQAALSADGWKGRPDFLIRTDRPSALGGWSYEVVDAKLARSAKPRALIQLGLYADLLGAEQGVQPERVHLFLGGAAGQESFRVLDYAAYYRRVKTSFLAAMSTMAPSYPEPVGHCAVCDWRSVCDRQWRDDDHLSLVAGISRNQRKALVGRQVATVTQLASLPLPIRPVLDRVGAAAATRIREQARIQVAGRSSGGQVLHEIIEPIEPERGLAALPEPSEGDLFLDLEGEPYVGESGLEYLFGVVERQNGEPAYRRWWSQDRQGERRAFEELVDVIVRHRSEHPSMHVYHYNHYEPTALKKLAGRYNTRVDTLDDLLRGKVFVDLYRVVRQGLRASVESYSIKCLEPLYGFTRSTNLRDATRALQAVETWLHLGRECPEPGIMAQVEDYNRDDCLSAYRLREWLETERHRLGDTHGVVVPRPAPGDGTVSEGFAERQARVQEVMDRLLAGVPDDVAVRSPEQAGRWLVAQLLEWHRREEKSTWWEYHRLCDLTDEELQEEKAALGGLTYEGPVASVKRSIVHRYRFPRQEHGLKVGCSPHDPRTKKSAGTVVAIDELECSVDVKRGGSSTVAHPEALILLDMVGSNEQRESLMRLGASLVNHGSDDASRCRLAWDILLRRHPRLLDRSTGGPLVAENEDGVAVAVRLGLALDSSVLAIQGPPGSGKTHTGAAMILSLVNAQRKVGIVANSHRVISTLIHEVCRAAREATMAVQVIQKVSNSEADGVNDDMVTVTADNGEVVEALASGKAQIAAGTAWLWARAEMVDSVDVLFADEAGQLSLANVLAVAPATASMVLLGDPQQLDQPQKGVHPPGADASALGHLLGGHDTIDAEHGIFLEETWRLHPDVCEFISETFYEGRLRSHPPNALQRVDGSGALSGTGLRYLPVSHLGNQSESVEEANAVAWLVDNLLQGSTTWTDREGRTHSLTLADILVVSPYNAHVAELICRLPEGARVGTVDKFQGQQAPIVIYSMATSTPEDAPRGMEFLYRPNRLNVAISRARCLAVLVGSPALFDVACETPRQMVLANAICRFLELATVVERPD